jgi:hypothetical protein
LPEFRTSEPPARASLLRAVAADLHTSVPGFRPIAEGLLAQESRIDLFGVDALGAAVLVSVGDEAEALARIGRLLAQRRWLEPRLADWLKLAPQLELKPDLPSRAVLVCASFGPEARLAAEALDGAWLQLVRYRSVHNGAGDRLLLEPLDAAAPVPARPTSVPDAAASPPASFRTGLSDDDLGLSEAERSEFE